VETGVSIRAEVGPVPVKVPGSVQKALRDAGIIPDWNIGMNARLCEWVENRDWIFRTEIPPRESGPDSSALLILDGLDGNGRVLVNGSEISAFDNAFTPHEIDLGGHLVPGKPARLEIVFEPPPRWLGQIGYTSKMKQWKPRFNYSWDWISRIVQIGIWDGARIEISNGSAIAELRCVSHADHRKSTGRIEIHGKIENPKASILKLSLTNGKKKEIFKSTISSADFSKNGFVSDEIPVSLWYPNGLGEQNLYRLEIELMSRHGTVEDKALRVIGFRSVEWEKCDGAPEKADPWICVVNGKPVFLQGINWTPLLPNFADVTGAAPRKLIRKYKEMGCNLLRVWGGATLERESFYEACDNLGLMIWQEFPLSSSGIDNHPPDDEKSISELSAIARSYLLRRQHHPSLIIWCGGNELQTGMDGSPGGGKPIDASHPAIAKFAEIVKELDPGRRFLPTSSSGPLFYAGEENYGKGLHWDIHGPWGVVGNRMERQREYWSKDDSLFRSEVGCPGASPIRILEKYSGGKGPLPVSLENPLWHRTSWWFDWPEFEKEKGRNPRNLGEYVKWSQARQAEALSIAAKSAKSRFPKCGGFIVWMGHDSFPCTVNTSIIDFEGKLKPAAKALKKIFLGQAKP
jgi:beta-mannosidase